MSCADCGLEVLELITCEVCGRKVCLDCFAETHDGITLGFELVKKSVDDVKVS